MKFSPKKYDLLKSKLEKKYALLFRRSIDAAQLLPESPLKKWISSNKNSFKNYSHINWHFLHLLNQSLFFSAQDPLLGKHHFGEQEEVVFEKWNQSEFADIFLKSLNQGKHLGAASLFTLKKFNQHIIVFGDRHILRTKKKSSHYRHQHSLGEFTKNNEVFSMHEKTLHIDGKSLVIKSYNEKEGERFKKKIETALKLIIEFSPDSWDSFKAFTDVIIPIKERQIVSYSHQDLPAYSIINLYHRDFVDLMDDLLHENGHHHMNHYLNLDKLIEEPIENNYYSPWRRTLRPLRGIYHAYFTFFWAFKLFSDLSRSKDLKNNFYLFSNEEKEKIIWRVLEEYYMLNYTFHDLKLARKKGLIHDAGWPLIIEQQNEIKKFSRYVPALEKKLKTHKKDLVLLKEKLLESKNKYQIRS